MDRNLEKFIKKLRGFEAQPPEDSFDNIFDEFKKEKRRSAIIPFWFGFALVLTLFSSGVFLFSFSGMSKTDTALDEERVIEPKQLATKTKVGASVGRYENPKLVKPEKMEEKVISDIHKEEYAGQIISYANSSELSQSRSKVSRLIGQQVLTKQEILVREKVSKVNSIEINDTYFINDEKEQKVLGKLDQISREFDPRYSFLAILPLVKFDIEERQIERNEYALKTDVNKKKINYSIETFAELGNQQFCAFTTARQKRFGAAILLNVNQKLSFSFGMSRASLEYEFELTEDLNESFGSTDKFPVLLLLKNKTETISNRLNYSSVDFGVDLQVLRVNRFALGLRLNQEIVLSQDQEFIYDLKQLDKYTYQKNTNTLLLHQFKPSMQLSYGLNRNFNIVGRLTYNYGINFIGMEKEKYSGFNMGAAIRYTIK